MDQPITLKELAKKLDLSISTVSKALNDSEEISIVTKKRVRELSELLGYIPNSFAQSLKFKKTQTIGVIVPAILSNFFSMVIDGIEEKATKLGYKINIYISKESLEKEKQAIQMLIRSQVDGIILSPSKETQLKQHTEHLNYPSRFGVPIVMFDRLIDSISCDKVSIDDTLEAELATTDLILSGCSKVSYISGIWNTSVNENRKQGYLKALEKKSLPPLELNIDCDSYPVEKVISFLKNEDIDAILASDELTTVLTARHILKSNLRIPEDISLIGFTNGKMGETYTPSISTVDQKAKEQGEVALQTMVDRLKGLLPPEPVSFTLKANIIHRESTKPSLLSKTADSFNSSKPNMV